MGLVKIGLLSIPYLRVEDIACLHPGRAVPQPTPTYFLRLGRPFDFTSDDRLHILLYSKRL
jgi:hypothetical protein